MNRNNTDYYSKLGVSRDADIKEIKMAYRKKARQLHPDKNLGDPESAKLKFQEIVQIYEVLKDNEKRAIYDKFGEAGLENSGFSFDPNNLDDLFAAAFGDDTQFDEDDIKTDILATVAVDVTLKDVYTGINKTIIYGYKYDCSQCRGKGKIVNDIIKECNSCNSTGKYIKKKKAVTDCTNCESKGIIKGPLPCNQCKGNGYCSGMFGRIYDCQNCDGSGKITRFKCCYCDGKGKRRYWQKNKHITGKCNVCKGNKYTQFTQCNICKGDGKVEQVCDYKVNCHKCNGQGFNSKTTYTHCRYCQGVGKLSDTHKGKVYISPGVCHNDTIKVPHNDHNRGIYGVVSVKINLSEQENGSFVRSNDNLVTIKTISLRQALLGGEFIINHIDGSKLLVKCNHNILQINQCKKIKGKGMPIKGVERSYGDLFIKFKIKMPTQLSHYNIKQICQHLPTDDSSFRSNNAESVDLIDLNGFDEMEISAVKKKTNTGNDNEEIKDEENVDCKQM